MQPRYYQQEAVDAFFSYYDNGGVGNTLTGMPTGTGKSLILALLIKEILRRYPKQRIVMLTHVKELIQQNYKTLLRVWPTAPAGIYSSGLNRKDSGFPITYAGIATVYSKPHIFQNTDIILIDEAHLISTKESSMYGEFFAAIRRYKPYLLLHGLTATPFRLGQGMLTQGEDALFNAFSYDITGMADFNRLIDEGFLSPLIPLRTKTELDIEGLRISQGEFSINDMQKRYNVDDITIKALEEAIVQGYDRKHWLIFATGIEHCERIAKLLTEKYGISAKPVHSKLKKDERDATIQEFKSGTIRAVVNNNVLTTGFDFPGIDLIIVLRPTMSPGLWVQLLGRGTRPCEGKENCIASGQKVLTDLGLVPIEKITREMKIWDGLDFVSHGGLTYQGEQETIEYAGLIATANHRVKTEKGWQTFGDCCSQQTPIVTTGNGKQIIRESENYFTRYNKRTFKKSSCFNRMFNLRKTNVERVNKCKKRKSRLSQMRSENIQATHTPTMVIQSLFCGLFKRVFGRTNNRKILSEIIQTKRHTWDILNCGPRNSFTCEGLLVHNCLVLDFASNTKRLGPINDPCIPMPRKKNKGDAPRLAPVKICDNCGMYNHTTVRICSNCGYEFPKVSKIRSESAQDELIKREEIRIEIFKVTSINYDVHSKKGKPDSLCVTYFSGFSTYRKWICLEHPEPAGHNAREWWRAATIEPHLEPPESVAMALVRTSELRDATHIRVRTDLKWPQIMDIDYSGSAFGSEMPEDDIPF